MTKWKIWKENLMKLRDCCNNDVRLERRFWQSFGDFFLKKIFEDESLPQNSSGQRFFGDWHVLN